MRTCVVGDLHLTMPGAPEFLFDIVRYAADHGAERLVLLGDVNYAWPGSNVGTHLMRAAEVLPVDFVDGNHENHDALEHGASDPVEVLPGVRWLPRGARFVLGSTLCMSMGGGISIDRKRRTDGLDYWWRESIGEADVHRALADGGVDLMLTHDAPSSVSIPGKRTLQKDHDRASAWNRAALQAVLEHATPALLLHGHHHVRHEFRGDIARVIGLGSNHGPLHDAIVMLNL